MRTAYKIAKTLAPYLPVFLKDAIRSSVSFKEYDFARQREDNPFRNQLAEVYPESHYHVCILKEIEACEQYYVAACRDMKLSYTVVDLLADDWIERYRSRKFDAVLVWPSSASTVIKQVFDYRLHILEKDLEAFLFPSWKECWLTEHKPRIRDWLAAHKLPQPQTWVFHDKSQALKFSAQAELPVVLKTATGSGATGVSILKTREALRSMIHLAFGRGMRPERYDARDRQRGFVYIQEYLPNVEEWRMVRIGDSYFGYRKEKGADGMHSASHKWTWLDPGQELLNLLKKVTDEGGFRSMDVDIFRTDDGRLLVSELQTVFGCNTPAIYMKVNNVEGRYILDGSTWKFEPGEFWKNQMCNLRVEYLLSRLATDGGRSGT